MKVGASFAVRVGSGGIATGQLISNPNHNPDPKLRGHTHITGWDGKSTCTGVVYAELSCLCFVFCGRSGLGLQNWLVKLGLTCPDLYSE